MGKLRRGSILGEPGPTHDVSQSIVLRGLVDQICNEQGVKPPSWVAVLGSHRRRSNAMAVRVGRMGTGFLVITPGLFQDLDSEERRFVLRHELAHYRHAESRWALLQAMAFLSPFWVVIFGWSIAHVIGEVATLGAYLVALFAHACAFRSKRFFERRADREAIDTAADAVVAKRTLIKISTLHRRRSLGVDREAAEQVMADFERDARRPANLSLRIFNAIWGTHPLVQERLATYESLTGSGLLR